MRYILSVLIIFITACTSTITPITKEQVNGHYDTTIELVVGLKEECEAEAAGHKCHERIGKVEKAHAEAKEKVELMRKTGVLVGDEMVSIDEIRGNMRVFIIKQGVKKWMGL